MDEMLFGWMENKRELLEMLSQLGECLVKISGSNLLTYLDHTSTF